MTRQAKPTAEELGVDTNALAWRSSSDGRGAIEVAFTKASGHEWVLMRLSGEPNGLISVFSRVEWDCFLDGVRKGEFDDVAS